jgi:hypothetical protein
VTAEPLRRRTGRSSRASRCRTTTTSWTKVTGC